MAPVWFFTHPVIEEYMLIAIGRIWDPFTVGARLEAFGVAGCALKGTCAIHYLMHAILTP